MNSEKVVPKKLCREVYRALEDIVGPDWISEDRAIIEANSKVSVSPDVSLRKHQKDASLIPACVVLPQSTEEVQAIVRVAARYKVPFTLFANGQMFSHIPKEGSICLSLKRMDKILDIDEKNLTARLQPNVDYRQLQAETMKRGLWNGGCVLATSICKLASQWAAQGFWQTDLKFDTFNTSFISVKMVLPNGEILNTGASSVSSRPRPRRPGPAS